MFADKYRLNYYEWINIETTMVIFVKLNLNRE